MAFLTRSLSLTPRKRTEEEPSPSVALEKAPSLPSPPRKVVAQKEEVKVDPSRLSPLLSSSSPPPTPRTVTKRPTLEDVSEACDKVFAGGSEASPSREWARTFLAGLAPCARSLSTTRTKIELDVEAEGEIATRSRLGMQWRASSLSLRVVEGASRRSPSPGLDGSSSPESSSSKILIRGLRLVPIEGAEEALRGLQAQWIADGVMTDWETTAEPKAFLESAWKWWKRDNHTLAETKYWRVCESLIGKQVVRSTASTADLALVVVGCACGCAWNITAAVFGRKVPASRRQRRRRPDDDATPTTTTSSHSEKNTTTHTSSTPPPPPPAPSCYYSPTNSSGTGTSTSEGEDDDAAQQMHLEYEPALVDDPLHAFKAALSEKIMRDSFSSNLTVRLCRKFATSAFNFALAFYDLSDIGLPRADPALLSKLFQASDVVGGASNADRLKGALWWQKDDLTYKMTGNNGRVLWHVREGGEEDVRRATATTQQSATQSAPQQTRSERTVLPSALAPPASPRDGTSEEEGDAEDDDSIAVTSIADTFSETDDERHRVFICGDPDDYDPASPDVFFASTRRRRQETTRRPRSFAGKSSRHRHEKVVEWATATDCALPTCL